MKEITPQVYQWSRYAPDERRERNGHFVRGAAGEPGVVIDPVPLHEGDEAHLRELGGVAAVLLTGPAGPVTLACAASFGCPVRSPASGDDGRSGSITPARSGEALPAGLQVIPLPADGSDRAAYYHPESQSLFAGAGTVVGDPAGTVRLPAAGGATPEAAAREARRLRALLTHPTTRLLLGDGCSLLNGPARAIQDLLYRHDPAAWLLRPAELRAREARVAGRRYHVQNADGARLLGLTAHDFDVSAVSPGRENYPLHRHDGDEEVFVILEGEGELRTEQGVFPVRAGDILGFPPRYQVAHTLRNTGAEELRYLSFSAPAERLGMVDYPESGQRAEFTAYGKRHRFFRPERMSVGYWEGTPTD
jgi:uncharacterized cupin superfamily protein